MGLATFRGGVHTYEGKNLSEHCEIRPLEFDGEYVFPMSQGIGAPSKPIVAKGDYVLAGQKIAEPGGFVSAVVNSSVSGTVKAVEPRLTTMGTKTMSVVIESDGKYETVSTLIAPGKDFYDAFGTYDGQDVVLYLNGKEVARSHKPGKMTHPNDPIVQAFCLGSDIAQDGGGSGFFAGKIVRARVYTWALTAEQIARLH